MANLRQIVDGVVCTVDKGDDAKNDVFNHLKQASDTQSAYNIARIKLATKMAPMRSLLQLMDQMHDTDPNSPNNMANDPFQQQQQQGPGGPGGVGQGMDNQNDLPQMGQMKKPVPGAQGFPPKAGGQAMPGKPPMGNGNKKLMTPDGAKMTGRPQQRSTSGNKKPGKTTKATDNEGGRKTKITISHDDHMDAGGPGSGRHKGTGGVGHPEELGKAKNFKGGFVFKSGRHRQLSTMLTRARELVRRTGNLSLLPKLAKLQNSIRDGKDVSRKDVNLLINAYQHHMAQANIANRKSLADSGTKYEKKIDQHSDAGKQLREASRQAKYALGH